VRTLPGDVLRLRHSVLRLPLGRDARRCPPELRVLHALPGFRRHLLRLRRACLSRSRPTKFLGVGPLSASGRSAARGRKFQPGRSSNAAAGCEQTRSCVDSGMRTATRLLLLSTYRGRGRVVSACTGTDMLYEPLLYRMLLIRALFQLLHQGSAFCRCVVVSHLSSGYGPLTFLPSPSSLLLAALDLGECAGRHRRPVVLFTPLVEFAAVVS